MPEIHHGCRWHGPERMTHLFIMKQVVPCSVNYDAFPRQGLNFMLRSAVRIVACETSPPSRLLTPHSFVEKHVFTRLSQELPSHSLRASTSKALHRAIIAVIAKSEWFLSLEIPNAHGRIPNSGSRF